MVNKKKQQKNRDYCRSFCQKKGDLYKTNNSTTKKTGIERRKYLEPKKYEEYKKKEVAVSENIVKKKRCHRNYRSALQRQPQK